MNNETIIRKTPRIKNLLFFLGFSITSESSSSKKTEYRPTAWTVFLDHTHTLMPIKKQSIANKPTAMKEKIATNLDINSAIKNNATNTVKTILNLLW